MQGHFDLAMLDTPELTKFSLDAVRAKYGDAGVEDMLREFDVEGQWHTDNLVFKTAPSWYYYTSMGNPGQYSTAYGWNETSRALLAFIALTTTSSEPTYAGEVWTSNLAWDNTPDLVPTSPSAPSGCHKVFINDCIVSPDIKCDPTGREAIYAKFKWLFLPGEATTPSIKSITIYAHNQTGNLAAGYGAMRLGRVRLKDSGGNPVTLNKSATKSLLVEYTYTLASI